jgi:DNA repair protein RecO (recombination protein O)
MIQKTQGIVLHSFRYGETSIIARIFTRDLGMQSFLVPGVRKTRSRVKMNLFQPLTPVELVVYFKEGGGLLRIKEVSCPEPLKTIPYTILKSAVAMFLSEVLAKSLKEQDPNAELFAFLEEAVGILDRAAESIADFHMVFLLQLSSYLGFQPRNNHDQSNCFFNLREGLYERQYENGEVCLDRDLSQAFHEVSTKTISDFTSLRIPAVVRRQLLARTIDYYRYHMPGIGEIRSHPVLETVLH